MEDRYVYGFADSTGSSGGYELVSMTVGEVFMDETLESDEPT